MVTQLQEFVFFRSPCGDTHVAWAKIHDGESLTVIYLPEGSMSPVEELLTSPEPLNLEAWPSSKQISEFWRDYRSCPGFTDDISRRHPDFKSAYIDWLNRKRAGGWAR